MSTREPLLAPVSIVDLRPTQITVGFREVAEKRREWNGRPEKDRPAFLGRHMIPVLLGPEAAQLHHRSPPSHPARCTTRAARPCWSMWWRI